MLILAGANIEAREVGGSIFLNCAHDLKKICALVDRRADVNTQGEDGHKPLHNAVHDPDDQQHSINTDIVEVVDFLLTEDQ